MEGQWSVAWGLRWLDSLDTLVTHNIGSTTMEKETDNIPSVSTAMEVATEINRSARFTFHSTGKSLKFKSPYTATTMMEAKVLLGR
jgi:hypothetical protein